VLAEARWVVRSVYGSASQLAASVAMILSEKHVTLEDPEVVEALLDLSRSRPALKFSDCVIVHWARKAGHLALGTFAGELGNVWGT
jgi:predicted nucleic acid-binding protein